MSEIDARLIEAGLQNGLITEEMVQTAREEQKRLREEGMDLCIDQVLIRLHLLAPAGFLLLRRELARGKVPGGSEWTPGRTLPHDTVPDWGDYLLEQEIGRGGFGIVYRARDRRSGEPVALKFLLSSIAADPRARGRFERESAVLAMLDHPAIVQVLESGSHDGVCFLAMELVSGGSLRARLQDGARIPAPELASILAQVARGVHHAHERAVLHRDLKPDNVLLDDRGRPRVTDFGLAKLVPGGDQTVQVGLTSSGEILGSPLYMPPEQALGDQDRMGPPADVYGLGAILYEALAGRPPFMARSRLSLLQKIMTEEPVPPGRVRPSDWPPELERLCLRALAKDPNARPASAVELAEELERSFGTSRTAVPRRTRIRPENEETSHGVSHAPRLSPVLQTPALGTRRPRSLPRRGWVLLGGAALLAAAGLAWSVSRPDEATPAARPPGPPASGPGGTGDYTTECRLVARNNTQVDFDIWIFGPRDPVEGAAAVYFFPELEVPGATPERYGAWIRHLVRRGHPVVYFEYRAQTLSELIQAFRPGGGLHAAVRASLEPLRPSSCVAFGHARGSLAALRLLGLWSGFSPGTPLRAVLLADPDLSDVIRSMGTPQLALRWLFGGGVPGCRIAVVLGEDDLATTRSEASLILDHATAASLGRTLLVLPADGHGAPALVASRATAYASGDPSGDGPAPELAIAPDPLDWYGTWRVLDLLLDGGSDEALPWEVDPRVLAMPTWSDGTPMRPIRVEEFR